VSAWSAEGLPTGLAVVHHAPSIRLGILTHSHCTGFGGHHRHLQRFHQRAWWVIFNHSSNVFIRDPFLCHIHRQPAHLAETSMVEFPVLTCVLLFGARLASPQVLYSQQSLIEPPADIDRYFVASTCSLCSYVIIRNESIS
jgi:hypothetical protein